MTFTRVPPSGLIPPSFFALFLSLSLTVPVAAGIIPDRRQNEAASSFGYLLYPIIGKVPGVGAGYGAGILINNLINPDSRFTAFTAGGGIKALGVNVSGLELIPDHVTMYVSLFDTVLPSRVYGRGMNSGLNDYLIEQVHERGGSTGITLKLWEKRIQTWARAGYEKYAVESVIHPLGLELKNRDTMETDLPYSNAGISLDLTDDRNDPRQGFRIDATRLGYDWSDPRRSKYHSWNFSTTFYLATGEKDTWAFNYFRSKSYVTSLTNATGTELNSDITADCTPYLGDELSKCNEVNSRRVAQRQIDNQFGSASYLGGESQMRSFPNRRFMGSETVFYGTEYRWNLTEEATPIDLLFIKGVRSNFQWAFFYEAGAVTDPPNTIENAPLRASYGTAIRMIFSGAVLRIEAANGLEGSELILFYGYPWGLPYL